MAGPSPLNILFAIVFVAIGLFMAMLSLAMLSSGPKNETEWTIVVFGFLSASLLFYGAYKTWRNHTQKAKAEKREATRLAHKFAPRKANQKSIQSTTDAVPVLAEDSNNSGDVKEVNKRTAAKPSEESTKQTGQPEILARWTYPKKSWQVILAKLAEKTRKEELYTAFWFPVLFAIVFWSMFWVGILIGVAFGALYVWFRTDYVKRNFKIKGTSTDAEVIITDAYMRVNGHFVHYADGKYYLKSLEKEVDNKLGALLHFEIGWLTSKGLPASMDLYLPIPTDKKAEAEAIVAYYHRGKT